jgi:primosomal protein N' (replication factor Y)
MDRIASIIVDNTSKELDRAFDYKIPENMYGIVKKGMRIVVPFGGGNKYIEGYVIDIKNYSEFGVEKLKYIADIIDDDIYIDEEMLKTAYFLKDKYACTMGEAFKMIMPSGISVKENLYIRLLEGTLPEASNGYTNIIKHLDAKKFIEFKKLKKVLKSITRTILYNMEKDGIVEVNREMEQNVNKKILQVYVPSDNESCTDFINNGSSRYKKQIEILKNYVLNNERLGLSELSKKYGCSVSVIKALEEKGFLVRKEIEIYRNPSDKEYEYGKVELTSDQVRAVEGILENYKKNKTTTLIHGVTGCGKTEIYLNMVERTIKKGNGAIVMVPEIALTPQTLERFKGRFGEVVAILHSKLSDGERYDEWRRIKSGEVKVVVGARSAVFAPVKNLKLIVIDEEHEYSYKSETTPKYLTKEVAEFRIGLNRGMLILGSATPSLESYYKALMGEYGLIEIASRINNQKLPAVKIINMCEELKQGNKSMFSRELMQSIKNNLENREQTILFLNRRGHSTFISCRSCGYVSKCKNCDVSLTYHVHNNKLMCHYCGFEYDIPQVCPECGSKYIKYFGAGTEKIEMEVKRIFPEARILRMDMDTTRRKGEHERLYNEFKDYNADILIGTQMISKGMDFKNVTLVGIVAADTTLNLPDFRAAERTFQLLTQVSGRAGRGSKEGKVVVQTYDPDHYSIIFASRHNYIDFYKKEIELRRILNNPPFSDILYVTLLSESEEQLLNLCMKIKYEIKKHFNVEEVEMLGPSPCHIPKIKNSYRWHIIFKGNVFPYYKPINDELYRIVSGSSVNYNIDMNPYSML